MFEWYFTDKPGTKPEYATRIRYNTRVSVIFLSLQDMGSLGGTADPATDGPASIPRTPEEVARGQYSRAKLQHILERFNEDGFIVLEDLVDPVHVDAIAAAMHAETPAILANDKVATFNHGVRSNILQCAPLRPELIFEDVYLNPFVIQVMNAYLGARPRWNFITGNTALARTDGLRQPVHKDIAWRDHPTAPFYVIANVLLADFGPENGSTEFWLGSHKNTTTEDQDPAPERACFVLEDKVEARRKIRPPVQTRARKGKHHAAGPQAVACGDAQPER